MLFALHFQVLIFLASLWSALPCAASTHGLQNAAAIQREHVQTLKDKYLGVKNLDSSTDKHQNKKRQSLIQFKNPKAKEFHVDGTKIPDGMLLRDTRCALYT